MSDPRAKVTAMSIQPLHDAQPPIRRDRYDRPYIIPPGGGKAVPYARVTTLAGTLEDRYHLERWKQRQTAIGLSLRPALQAMVASHREDKDVLNNVCEEAMQAAAASDRASLGTALHAFAAQIDRGLEVISVPADIRRDLDAYALATKKLEHLAIERFVVCDLLKVAGTPDRLSKMPDGTVVIADLKTGDSVDLARGAIAIQLACYSRSKFYDPVTGERTEYDVDQMKGLIIHLPAGSAHVDLYWVDLERGWDAALTADWTRSYRTDRKLMRDAVELIDVAAPMLEMIIDGCDSVAELEAAWREYNDLWLPIHTRLAAARKAALTGVKP